MFEFYYSHATGFLICSIVGILVELNLLYKNKGHGIPHRYSAVRNYTLVLVPKYIFYVLFNQDLRWQPVLVSFLPCT